MATLGPVSGSVFADDATVGAISATNPENAAVSDDVYVTWTLLAGQVGHYLIATGFGCVIPSGATILGIQVDVERSATLATTVVDHSVRVVKGGLIVGDDKASGTPWPSAAAYQAYGSAADLWGASWSSDDINASDFGVAISPSATLAATAQVDHIQLSVTYDDSNRVSVANGFVGGPSA